MTEENRKQNERERTLADIRNALDDPAHVDIKTLTQWLGAEGALAKLEKSKLTNAELMLIAREAGLSVDKKTARKQIVVELVMSNQKRIEKDQDYLLRMSFEELQRYFSDVLNARVLAGTGMSNTMKHLSEIEKNNLKARRIENGYEIHGGLPWVSNLGKDHLLAVTAQTEEGGYVMFVVSCNEPGIRTKACPEFCALEGTRTFSVSFNDVQISDANVLAQPDEFKAYIKRIKPGFILLQIGMGLGVIDGCVQIIERANNIANPYLDDVEPLLERVKKLEKTVKNLAAAADVNQQPILPVLYARAEASELALALAQLAALHTGARGYLRSHAAFRRQREAMFVAIVTPSLRHLRREIALLEEAAAKVAEEEVA